MRRFPVATLMALALVSLPLAERAGAQSIPHQLDLATHLPPHLTLMYSMSWFGIPASDPQGPGPDPSYANGAESNSCSGTQSQSNPAACSPCILKGVGDACLKTGAPQRDFASRRRPLAGIYSASARDAEGLRRIDLMLSTLRRPCDDGAKIDAWIVQLDGTRDTALHPANPACTSCDLAYHATLGFYQEADAAGLSNAVMPGDDSTWYFHFGDSVGLGKCDDSPGNPKQRCVDALTGDLVDMSNLAAAHPSALLVNGHPVLFVYLDPAQLSPAEWQTLLQNARDRSGRDFYAVAAIQNPTRSDYFAAFDALAPWVQLDWAGSSGATVRAHATAYAAALHDKLITDVAGYAGRVVLGGVSPGFDDFTEDWGKCRERTLPAGDPRNPDFLLGQFDYLKSKSLKGVLLETWDDWTEGTELEPDVEGGSSVLVSLRQQLGGLYGESADGAGDSRLAARWSAYGQARNCAGGTAAAAPATILTCPPSRSDGGTGDDGGTAPDLAAALGSSDAGRPVTPSSAGCGCTLGGRPRTAQVEFGLGGLALAFAVARARRRRGRLMTVATIFVAGCTAITANSNTKVEVSFQSSTHLWDDGAAIEGTVCFDRVHWDVSLVQQAGGTAVDVRADRGHFLIGPSGQNENRIVGAKGGRGANQAVDVRFGPDHLIGRIGWHQYDLKPHGDHLEGSYQLNAMPPVRVKLFGMETFWSLPPAEQAVLLPLLLFCTNNSSTHDFEIDLRDLKLKRNGMSAAGAGVNPVRGVRLAGAVISK